MPIQFEWDTGNKDKNWQKHHVHYKEAEEVFLNKPIKIYKDITHSQKEVRFTALGVTNRGRRLYITFTLRESTIRVISARDQDKKERREYEKK